MKVNHLVELTGTAILYLDCITSGQFALSLRKRIGSVRYPHGITVNLWFLHDKHFARSQDAFSDEDNYAKAMQYNEKTS